MTNETQQSEVERLKREVYDALCDDAVSVKRYEWAGEILDNLSDAIRAEAAAEIAKLKENIEGLSALLNVHVSSTDEVDEAVAVLLEYEPSVVSVDEDDESTVPQRIRRICNAWAARWRNAVMDVEKIRAAQPCFQSTPSVAEIEAHGQKWPAEKEGGYWLEVENGEHGMYSQITRLAIVDGKPVFYDGYAERWSALAHHASVQYTPLQPNGVPVGMAVAEDLVQCRQCNYNGTLDECPSRMPDYAVECPSCMSNELTVYRVSEDAAPAVEVTPDEQ